MDRQREVAERQRLPKASKWAQYEGCAGAFQLEQEAARLGQSAHQIASAAAAGGLRIHAYLAGVPDEDGKEIVLNESEQQMADFLQERAQEQVTRIFGDAPTQTLVEKRLWLEVNGRRVASGRFDRVVYTPEVALVQDFKTGWAEPDPTEINSQLKFLAVLVGLHLPGVTEVIVQIVSGPYGVTEARYSLPALSMAYRDIRATLAKIQAPDAPLTPSPEACRYCAAINICSKVWQAALTRLQITQLPLSGEHAAKILDQVGVLRTFCDQVEEFYSSKLSADPSYQVPGYVMAPGMTRREVSSWESAHARLGEFLETADLWGAAAYRLGDIEKALAKKLGLKAKEAKERVNQILGELITEKQNGPSLKRVKGEPKVINLASQ